MTEEELITPIVMTQLIDYVHVPTIKAQLLQLLAKYEERPQPMARAVVIDGKKGIRVGDSRQISDHRFHTWKILLFQEKMSGP
ncbi:hypothetical protein TNCV_3350131 [Trichonephila clavipes]|nr:hypothetical protein TNCV_3350131 [Trichonephila clavipes]